MDQDVLGDLCADSVNMTAATLRPEVVNLGADGKTSRTVIAEVPDYIAVHGRVRDVRGRGRVAHGAPLVVTMRSGPSGPYIFAGMSFKERPRIWVHDHETDGITEIQWAWEGWQQELGLKARSTGEVYERYAAWWEGGQPPTGELQEEAWPRLVDAQRRMDRLHMVLEEFDTRGMGQG